MTERIAVRLVRSGSWLIVLGAIVGLLAGLHVGVAPSLLVATHVTMMITGTAFMCFGFMWHDVALDDTRQVIAASALAVAAYGTLVTGVFAALAGVGGRLRLGADQHPVIVRSIFAPLLPSSPDATPATGAENAILVGAIAVAIVAIVGVGLASWGLLTAKRRPETPAEIVGDQLRRLGVLFFAVGTFAILLTGLTPIPGLPVVTHVTIPIFGILFMGLGLVWPKLSLPEELHRSTLWLFVGGAAGILLAGLLAPILEVDTDTVGVSAVGVLASGGGELVVKLFAFVGALCMVGATYTVWAALRGSAEAAADRGDAHSDEEALTLRWIRVGTLLLFLGSLSALLAELTRAPRLAVGTYGTMPILAPLLICQGLAVPAMRLSLRTKKVAEHLVAIGAWGILVVGMVVALLGFGGETLTNSGRGFVGTEGQELFAHVLIDLSVLVLAVGIVMVWMGLREKVHARPILSRAIRLTGFVVLALGIEAAVWHVAVRATFGDAYPIVLPDVNYGNASYDTVGTSWLWDADSPAERRTAQNWTEDDWRWFDHATQGGAFEVPIPYDWLMALERPRVPLWPRMSAGLLMDPDYLVRFGFLANSQYGYGVSSRKGYDPEKLSIYPPQHGLAEKSTLNERPEGYPQVLPNDNPDDLPVGFARTDDWLDHGTGQRIDAIGFTCAACHTGQIEYVDTLGTLYRLRVEGGPANVDLGKFRIAVGISLFLTKMLPGRFDRFAATLGRDSTREDKEKLRSELDFLIGRTLELRDRQEGIYPTAEGFARLDAIGRIANHVLGNDLGIESNVQVANAPVNFPHIWDVPWFDWVQYNASFKQPMMRNAGESMGVFASLDLAGSGDSVKVGDDPLLFGSSVDIINLHEMESLVAGERPFEGLKSPEWPDVFPPIDLVARSEGDSLYHRYCDGCHLGSPANVSEFYDTTYWTTDSLYLRLRVADLERIGTDPLDALNFSRRIVDLGPLGPRLGVRRRQPYGCALPLLIRLTKERRYRDYGIDTPDSEPPAACDLIAGARVPSGAQPDSLERAELDGFRPDSIQGPLGYRARPLNGIWATPPYLHNGSVPTLYQLLSPQDERPDHFWLGSKLFDPDSVGLYYEATPGGFEFDTSLPGNSNEGHLFEGEPLSWEGPYVKEWRAPPGKKGVIGPELSPEQRMQIIEYLKWLPPLPSPDTHRSAQWHTR